MSRDVTAALTIAGALLTVTTLGAPVDAIAQGVAGIPRLGILLPGGPSDENQALVGLRQGLSELGYIEGRTIVLEHRWADGRPERYPELVAELLNAKVYAIVTLSVAALPALKQATSTLPVVAATFGDPVAAGYAESLARPGGNITGLTLTSPDLQAKRVQLLHEAVPTASRLALFRNPRPQAAPARVYADAAATLGLSLQAIEIRSARDLVAAFEQAIRAGAQALILAQDPLFSTERRHIADLALRHRLPTMSGETGFADVGGLMTYGASIPENFRRAATYVDRIIKGARPRDLPIEQPRTFELVMNLRTARALGLIIPPSLLLRADRIIE